MPDVTIVIVNHNRKDLLRDCLNSIEENDVSVEVFVVDNGSNDGSVEMLEDAYRWIHLIRNRNNERFAKPNNDAIRRASGRYILLLNNDAILRPGSLRELVSYLEAHPDVAMVGPQLLNPDGTIQRSCHGFVSLRTHCFDMVLLDRLFPHSRYFAAAPMTYFDYKTESVVDHVMAAAVLVRRDVLLKIGLFDEQLSVYYNDLDLSYRMAQEGWKSVFLPAAKVTHYGGHTAKPMMDDLTFFREQYENIFHYYRKHFGKRTVRIYQIMLLVGFLPRAVWWSVLSLFSRSERISQMRTFALRTVQLALSTLIDGEKE